MINVNISPFGRELMAMVLGVAKYHSMVNQKNIQNIQKQKEAINQYEKEQDLWEDISYNMTTRMIDKRYKSSQQFMESGQVNGSLKYKKNLSDDDKRFQYMAEQNMLKSRVRYNQSVSAFNKQVADRKVKGTFKLADLKKII